MPTSALCMKLGEVAARAQFDGESAFDDELKLLLADLWTGEGGHKAKAYAQAAQQYNTHRITFTYNKPGLKEGAIERCLPEELREAYDRGELSINTASSTQPHDYVMVLWWRAPREKAYEELQKKRKREDENEDKPLVDYLGKPLPDNMAGLFVNFANVDTSAEAIGLVLEDKGNTLVVGVLAEDNAEKTYCIKRKSIWAVHESCLLRDAICIQGRAIEFILAGETTTGTVVNDDGSRTLFVEWYVGSENKFQLTIARDTICKVYPSNFQVDKPRLSPPAGTQ